MKKYQRMHLIFIRQYIKQIMEYKVDFVVGVLGVFLTQGLNLLFLNVIFQHIPSLEGWTFPGNDYCWEIRCQSDASGAFAPVFWLLVMVGLVSVDLETSPVIYHHSRRLV